MHLSNALVRPAGEEVVVAMSDHQSRTRMRASSTMHVVERGTPLSVLWRMRGACTGYSQTCYACTCHACTCHACTCHTYTCHAGRLAVWPALYCLSMTYTCATSCSPYHNARMYNTRQMRHALHDAPFHVHSSRVLPRPLPACCVSLSLCISRALHNNHALLASVHGIVISSCLVALHRPDTSAIAQWKSGPSG